MLRWARLAVPIINLAAAGVPDSVWAQSPQVTTVTDEFDAKAADRARRKARSVKLPEFGELPAPQQQSRKPLFVLKRVSLVGAYTLKHSEIASSYLTYLGRSVSKADLAEITDKISGIYKQRGFALSRAFVPPQDVNDGDLTIKVVEGYVADVVVEGLGPEWVMARKVLSRIVGERPSRLATLERYMLLLSDLPGVRIRDAKLKELGNGSGRFRLTIKGEFHRMFVALDLDSRGSTDTGPWQSFSSIGFNSVARPGDVLLLNVSTIPNAPQELAYVGVQYDAPIGVSGLRTGVRVAYSEAKPNGMSHLIDDVTRTEDASVYASVVPLRSRALSIRLTGLVGAREVQETNNAGSGYTDHVRAVSLTLDTRSQDRLRGENYLALTARQGLPGLGGSAKGDLESSRPGASEEFSKLFINYNRAQPLAGPFSLWLAASGQLSSSPLLKSEEFFIGGPAFGRAFAPGAFWGDSGIAGLAELRLDQALDGRFAQGYQLYAFIDKAALWTRGFEYQQLSSYGAGLRLFVNEDLRAGLEVAMPIEVPTFASDPGMRIYFSLSRTFRGCQFAWCD